jgi:hypothetical protein
MEELKIINQIKSKKSFLCIGLDVDLNKIPKFLLKQEDPINLLLTALINIVLLTNLILPFMKHLGLKDGSL